MCTVKIKVFNFYPMYDSLYLIVFALPWLIITLTCFMHCSLFVFWSVLVHISGCASAYLFEWLSFHSLLTSCSSLDIVVAYDVIYSIKLWSLVLWLAWPSLIFKPPFFMPMPEPAPLSPWWFSSLLWAPSLSQMPLLCHLCHFWIFLSTVNHTPDICIHLFNS